MRYYSSMQLKGGAPGGFSAMDWSLYCVLVRSDRRAMGFKRAEDFSASIWRRTRVKVTQESVYKIERGDQIPDVTQFMAINIALYGSPFPERVIGTCMSPEWRSIAEAGGDIPREWRVENFEDAAGERAADPSLTAEEVAEEVGDAPGLFERPEDPERDARDGGTDMPPAPQGC